MNVFILGTNLVDRDQVSTTEEHPGHLQITFKNGDSVAIPWRDKFERLDILSYFPQPLGLGIQPGAIPAEQLS